MGKINGKIITNFIFLGFLLLFSILFIIKGIQLKTWTATESNATVSIQLLGFELFPEVSATDVSGYGNGFLIASVFTLVLALFPIGIIMHTLRENYTVKEEDNKSY